MVNFYLVMYDRSTPNRKYYDLITLDQTGPGYCKVVLSATIVGKHRRASFDGSSIRPRKKSNCQKARLSSASPIRITRSGTSATGEWPISWRRTRHCASAFTDCARWGIRTLELSTLSRVR
jgi:hypothetical protein